MKGQIPRLYGGIETDKVKRLRVLEAENSASRRIVTNQALELDATAKLLKRNGFRPQGRRSFVPATLAEHVVKLPEELDAPSE